jgi:flavin-dependent dehydrogenase
MEYDVAIIGGGPAGSTVGTLVKKYWPDAKVVILEREHFPRDHVGESQLPPITRVLEEMGCWDKVEAVGFPIKTGALYRWGSTDDLWRFDFLVGEEFQDNPRPSPLQGQRRQTTFHVERSIYDKILLDHAAELGVEVCEGVKVTKVERSGDRVEGLRVEGVLLPKGANEEKLIRAKRYIDGSGHVGILRRSMDVEVTEPSSLKNIAMWRYWQREDWASMDGVGCGGIRVRVLSLGNGWIWFIPISKDRVSIGFVTHADHYKQSGLTPSELYAKALQDEPHVAELLKGASPEGDLQTTKDWSFLAGRMTGENWLLVGESAGFADPILAGGMSLAMVGAREAAYILVAEMRREHDIEWLLRWYGELQAKRITQHIKFADYWYAANGHFLDLKEHTSKIAAEAGLELNPEDAFRWLAAGGFVSDDLTLPVTGTYRLGAVKSAMQILSGMDSGWEINRYNDFRLNLEGSEVVNVPQCVGGRIVKVKCYQRDGSLLPMAGLYRMLYRALCRERDAASLVKELKGSIAANAEMTDPYNAFLGALEALEGMVAEGWVTASAVPGRPFMTVTLDESSVSLVGQS